MRVKPNLGCKPMEASFRWMRDPNGTEYQEAFIPTCYSRFTNDREETAPFGPALAHAATDDEKYGFVYTPAELAEDAPVPGSMGVYPAGGYIVDIEKPNYLEPELKQYQAQKLSDAFARLRDAYWIDEQTRAVIIKLTFYNGACGGCPKLTVTSDSG